MGYISKTSTLNVPDYVFEDDYPLGTLAELRAFIDTHKHLPNVTSAAKIAHAGMAGGFAVAAPGEGGGDDAAPPRSASAPTARGGPRTGAIARACREKAA